MSMSIEVRDAVRAAQSACRKADACWAMNRYDDAWAHTQEASKHLQTALLADRKDPGE